MKKPFKLKSQGAPFKMVGSSPMRIVVPMLKGGWQAFKGLSKTKKYVAGATTGTAAESTFLGSKVLSAADDWFLFGAGKAWNKARSGGYLPGGEATITPYNPNKESSNKTKITKNNKSTNCNFNDKRCLR